MNFHGTIAFMVNPDKPEALEARNHIVQYAIEKKYQCLQFETTRDGVAHLQFPQVPDLIVAIGGDGTILKAAGISACFHIPILGVNLGRVGFLSETTPADFPKALLAWETDNFHIDERFMLRCTVNNANEFFCLNDVLLYKRLFSGVAQIDISINDICAGTLLGDGIIISTPTGSTAYSLSAGGPIIAPDLDAMIVTPVCPHSLYARPIVTGSESVLRFVMKTEGCLSADGRPAIDVGKNDVIDVMRANKMARFIRLEQQNIYKLIKEKL